jgi:deoxycytidine triphosphate deaminase
MAKIVAQEVLREAVRQSSFIRDGHVDCVEGIKYDFRLGSRILKARFGRPVDAEKLSESEKRDLYVEPGEMVFALTEERLVLPPNMIAFLSPKRKLSHAGVLVIGGLCIDPGYEGRLLIGLYNFSSTRYPLRPGKKVIAATFHELEPSERPEALPHPASIEDFPDELVEVMQKYEPSSIPSLAEAMQKIKDELATLRTEILSHEEWYKRLKECLDRHDQQIGDLIRGLAAEKEAREKGQDVVAQAVMKIGQTLSWLKGAAWVATGLIALVAVPVVVAWLLKALHLP